MVAAGSSTYTGIVWNSGWENMQPRNRLLVTMTTATRSAAAAANASPANPDGARFAQMSKRLVHSFPSTAPGCDARPFSRLGQTPVMPE